MSWSVQAVGKPQAVAAKLAADFEKITYLTEPERSVKNHAAAAIAVALASYPPGQAVSVAASGSQHAPDPQKPTEMQNSLSVKIDPMYGFIE